jgi:hypothetical protein
MLGKRRVQGRESRKGGQPTRSNAGGGCRAPAFQITTARRSSFVTDGQLGAVIGDKDGEQARGLRRAGVLTDEMLAARGGSKKVRQVPSR